jgi:hypothetical protein
MQQAVTTMTGITDTLGKQDTDIQTARTALIALMSRRALTMHAYTRARRSLLAAADQIAAGSPSTLNEWGFGATSMNTPPPPSNDPPTALRVRYNKALELEILWKSVPGRPREMVGAFAFPLALSRGRRGASLHSRRTSMAVPHFAAHV